VTAIGIGRAEFAAALEHGESGIREITGFEVPDGLPSLAAEVLNLDVTKFLRSTKNYLDRNSELSFAAFELAIRDAQLDLEKMDRRRIGFVFGTEWGNAQTLATFNNALVQKGPKFVPPVLFPHAYPNTTDSLISIEYGIKGMNTNLAGFGCSGAEAIAYGVDIVGSGRADVVIAGGADALTRELFIACATAGELSPGKSGGVEGCRPFAADRNGAVAGEGAAFVVLETAEHAAARGARKLATVTGISRMNVAELADVNPAVCAIMSSASGSVDGDAREESEITAAFGNRLPVTAIKSLCGDAFGASGAINIAAAVVAIENNFIPAIRGAQANQRISLVAERRSLSAGTVIAGSIDRAGHGVHLALTK
jgi:3-oxoacyl-[acyl-carrier-protein] synthase II